MYVLAFGFASFLTGLFGFRPDITIPIIPWFHATPAIHIPIDPMGAKKKPKIHIPIDPMAVRKL